VFGPDGKADIASVDASEQASIMAAWMNDDNTECDSVNNCSEYLTELQSNGYTVRRVVIIEKETQS
jgi:hypothetical protein